LRKGEELGRYEQSLDKRLEGSREETGRGEKS